jgi:hypothetical protein
MWCEEARRDERQEMAAHTKWHHEIRNKISDV